MKKILFIGCVGICPFLFSCRDKTIKTPDGQKTETPAIPVTVMKAFNARYPGITEVDWKRIDNDTTDIFEGDFNKDGKKIEVEFDDRGKFIREQ